MNSFKKLLHVSKPLRYTGGEYGQIVKDTKGKLRFCLAFPDVYEIGMSHLGFKILYTELNRSPKIACERFFAPWPDAWEKLGADIMVSLESKIPVAEFDVVGFSFQYELAYTTALQLLVRSGIPLKSADRGEEHPIVIAGGGCILNPAPLEDFIDVFFLGEMDSALNTAMEELHTLRTNGASRREQLEMLNKYPFTYIPQVDRNKSARREVYEEFSYDKSSPAPLVPIMSVIQDRISVEIARGCTNGCRFCQAGMIYRPVREKSVSTIYNTTMELVNATGYQEVSLLSLDTGDYSQIEELLDKLGSTLNSRNISLALPSLRAETVSPQLFEKIGAVRKSGFTIAPEAGTQRLRDIINKNLSEEDIINAALYAKNAGYNGVKLYFMCGLPYETDEDILGIADLVRKIRDAVKGGRFFDITLSMSNFVPKPHTPFERFGQISIDEMWRRQGLLKDALHRDKVKLKFHDPVASAIEASIARGDNRWSVLLTQAVKDGFYLDAWSEFFSRDYWIRLFEDNGWTVEQFSCQSWGDDEELPWKTVDSGIKHRWSIKERDKAHDAKTTHDCRNNMCSSCGVCDANIGNISAKSLEKDNPTPPIDLVVPDKITPIYERFELLYKRSNTTSLMSALDLSRIFGHMFLSAGVNIKFTEGFNPQPRMILQAPLPVGVDGERESLLFEADLRDIDMVSMVILLNKKAPDGLTVISVQPKVWQKNMSSYQMTFKFNKESFDFIYDKHNKGETNYRKLDKKGNEKTINLNDYLVAFHPEEHSIEVQSTELGGFHLPEFFKKSGYPIDALSITRATLVPIIK